MELQLWNGGRCKVMNHAFILCFVQPQVLRRFIKELLQEKKESQTSGALSAHPCPCSSSLGLSIEIPYQIRFRKKKKGESTSALKVKNLLVSICNFLQLHLLDIQRFSLITFEFSAREPFLLQPFVTCCPVSKWCHLVVRHQEILKLCCAVVFLWFQWLWVSATLHQIFFYLSYTALLNDLESFLNYRNYSNIKIIMIMI